MIGITLMGAGRMARVHAQAIPAAGAKLVSVYDVFAPAAEALAAETGAAVARSAQEAFERPDVAAVLVATSSDTHVEVSLQAVQAGKAVLCEKPLAEARRCVEALGEHAGKVFLAFNRRFDPGHAAVKEAIEAGEIGALEQLTITSRDPFPPRWSTSPNRAACFAT
jgi:myo-inositol 2-dehydrogenase / D-chiro-inositol 1-dehydrogenase